MVVKDIAVKDTKATCVKFSTQERTRIVAILYLFKMYTMVNVKCVSKTVHISKYQFPPKQYKNNN